MKSFRSNVRVRRQNYPTFSRKYGEVIRIATESRLSPVSFLLSFLIVLKLPRSDPFVSMLGQKDNQAWEISILLACFIFPVNGRPVARAALHACSRFSACLRVVKNNLPAQIIH